MRARSSACTQSIAEHHGVVAVIGAEHPGAMTTVVVPLPLVEQPPPDLVLGRSGTVFGGCLHSGLPLVGDGSCWAKMAGTAPLIVVTEVPAGGTVSGRVADVERSSADPRALSSRRA